MHKHSKLDVAVKQQGFVIAHPRQFNLISCDSKQIATEFAWNPTLEAIQISKLHGTQEIFKSLRVRIYVDLLVLGACTLVELDLLAMKQDNVPTLKVCRVQNSLESIIWYLKIINYLDHLLIPSFFPKPSEIYAHLGSSP